MKTLLQTEWLKIKNYTVFKVLVFCFIAGVILANYIVYLINKEVVSNTEPGKLLLNSFQPYHFEYTWLTTSYVTGCMLVLPAMLILILVTNEYTYRTGRQNIIDGWSRKDFIMVKFVLAILMALATTILVLFTATIFGFISGSDFSMTNISPIGFFFVKALTYNLFAVLISVLVKRTGFAIGLFFIYLGAENFLSLYLYKLSIDAKMAGHMWGDMGSYLPLSASDSLIPFPDNPIKSAAKALGPADLMWVAFGCAVAYIILFIWWSRRKFTKADL